MFAENLKKIRQSLGLSVAKFADKLEMSASTLTGYERGERTPSLNLFTQLCTKANVNINWVVSGKGEMFINECENSHALIENPDCISRFNKWGDRLCNLLTENEITPKTFAKLTGINFGRMQAFILDSAEPTMAELNSIKSNVDISLDELLYGEKVVTQNNAFSPDEIAKLKKLIRG